jgi:hypothetical protein
VALKDLRNAVDVLTQQTIPEWNVPSPLWARAYLMSRLHVSVSAPVSLEPKRGCRELILVDGLLYEFCEAI